MKDINKEELKKKIIEYFKEISKIPHPSHMTTELKDYLKKYAQLRGFDTIEDQGNLLINIPATEGYEEFDPIILQGHLDMVPCKTEDSNHNFKNDPIKIITYEDSIVADNTTLGGDDGIAIVYMMLIMNGYIEGHPELRLLLTADEEVGLLGAKALNPKLLEDSKYLINLDTEYECYMSVGGSGGEIIKARYKVEKSETLGTLWELSIKDLAGGHSGGALSNYGLHAARALAQILGHLEHIAKIRLVDFNVTGLDNAIATNGKATFITSADNDTIINNTIMIAKFLAPAYYETDPDLKIDLKPKGTRKLQAYTLQSTAHMIFNTLFMPYGIELTTDDQIAASNNISSCYTKNEVFTIRTQLRFRNENFRELIKNKIVQFFTFNGAFFEMSDYSPAWIENKDSELALKAQKIWSDLYDTELVKAAGGGILECGVFNTKNPNLDIISIGPTVENIHTPDEILSISSSIRVYLFLVELLKRLEDKEI